MRFLNIGIREVILLLVIMLILFGPNQMRENARNLARGIRKFVRSDTWRTFLGLVDDVNTIKDQVIRESGIQEVQDSLRGINRQLNDIDSDLHRTDPAETENRSEEPSQPDETLQESHEQ
jgi:Sec-independent protein translocase protein TatA